jgi:phosphohistidine phosphatase
MKLFIMRHGIAVPEAAAGLTDDERPLTQEGETKVKQVARGLRTIGVAPDRIVSSPLPRARRTAELAADTLGVPSNRVETSDVLRTGRPAESVRDWLLGRRDERLMIVGHNPTLSDLVALLVTGRPDLPLCDLRKGGVAGLEGDPRGRMTLDWLARPRLLRALED